MNKILGVRAFSLRSLVDSISLFPLCFKNQTCLKFCNKNLQLSREENYQKKAILVEKLQIKVVAEGSAKIRLIRHQRVSAETFYRR